MEVIYNTVGIVYAGMSDTTNSALCSFFLAMARNTDIMKTAQRHLDDVLGGERLPDHSDIDNLPYIMAIVKETFRWAPPVPIGVTHRLMEDDVYREMFIPGGATILENIWAICYDESVYPEPHTYNPARFLDKHGSIDPSVKAPEARIFGSGRRCGCPRSACQLLKYGARQDLSWTSLGSPDPVPHHSTYPYRVRHSSPCRRPWMFKDSRSQVQQVHYSTSNAIRMFGDAPVRKGG